MKPMQIIAMWTVGLASIVPAPAFGILGMQTDPNRIQTANEASKLPVGTPVIFNSYEKQRVVHCDFRSRLADNG
jgi:hypothetical protein